MDFLKRILSPLKWFITPFGKEAGIPKIIIILIAIGIAVLIYHVVKDAM